MPGRKNRGDASMAAEETRAKGRRSTHGETKGSTGRNPDSAKLDSVTGDEGEVRWDCAYVYVKPYLWDVYKRDAVVT